MTQAEAMGNTSLAELLGLKDKRIIWGRLIMFAVANIAGNAVFLIYDALRQGAMPRKLLLYFYMINLIAPLVRSAAVLVGFRFIKKELWAAALAATIYVPLLVPVRILFSPSFLWDYRLAYNWFWVFFELALLAAAVKLFRSLWVGLAVGSIVSALFANWIQTGIESVIQGRLIFSAGDLLQEAVLYSVSGLVLATVFWLGLRMAWCLPERLGAGTRASVLEAPGTFAGDPNAGLRRTLDFRALAGHLRSAGIGSLIFGVLAIALGAVSAGNSSINIVLVLLGIILIAEGTWVMAVPSPPGLIADGIVIILLGLWNLTVSSLNAGSSAPGGSGPFGILGLLQIGWGIRSIGQYRRFAYLRGFKPTEAEMKEAEARLLSIRQSVLAGAPDVIEFRTKTRRNSILWKGKLEGDFLLLLEGEKGIVISPKTHTDLTALEAETSDGVRKARLRLTDRTMIVLVGRESLERFNRWKTAVE